MDFLSLEQIKRLSVAEAADYCNLLRLYMVDTVTQSGGHLASNLGVAEISMACVRVFDIPRDKIIYDVGHQSYVHKLLTGRYFTSETLRTFGNFSGFTKREESIYDPFGAGHSSTALSAAVGFAKAARIREEKTFSVAVIGDGAFCTGMTFEALNNIDKNDKVIIVLNDNEMSISKNVGTMSGYLVKIRSTKKYLKLKRQTKKAFDKIPLIGRGLSRFVGGVKYYVKRIVVKNNFFEELGIDYLGPADGNDLQTVELLLREAANCDNPVLVHLCTKKGKGYSEAENDPDRLHAVSPSSNAKSGIKSTFSGVFGRYIKKEAEKDSDVVAVTAAMCDGTGLGDFKKAYPDRFFDVGICEEHAVTFCAAMRAGGLSPYFAVYSTFFQRAWDQLIHDCTLQDLKITLALDRAGFSPYDGATHHGVFDVSLLLPVPNLTIFSPATFTELEYSFDEGKKLSTSIAVRYPKGGESDITKKAFPTPCDFCADEEKCANVLIITYGRICDEALRAKALLEKDGISCAVLKFLKLKPINYSSVCALIEKINPKYIFALEEGIRAAGFSEHLFANLQSSSQKCDIMAINDTFVPHGSLSELYDFCGLGADQIYKRVLSWIKKA